ncbi:hypothetical protein Mame01_69480 [Microbispora amethystogenes]|nr:hypothetical protein Mame01_69480 [Microbispora amethystogenes]
MAEWWRGTANGERHVSGHVARGPLLVYLSRAENKAVVRYWEKTKEPGRRPGSSSSLNRWDQWFSGFSHGTAMEPDQLFLAAL